MGTFVVSTDLAPGMGPEGWNAALLGLFAREGGNGP